MISDISPLITQGLQLASMSAPFTDGYDADLFIAKYLQSIDEHCVCKLALVHHCIVKSMFDEHCRHTCKKREIPEIYLRKFFWIFRKILG